MIGEATYYRRGWKYLEKEETQKEVLDYLYDSLKNDDVYESTKTLIQIYDILSGKHKFFISRETPNVFKLREKREQIQEYFIQFFFKKHIDEMIELYKKFKNDNFALSYYLPLMTKYMLKGSPKPKHIVKLYLFHINNLITYKEEKDEYLRDLLRTISLKGLKRYACREEILINIIDEDDWKEYKNLNLDIYQEFTKFLTDNENPKFIEYLSLLIFIQQHILYTLNKKIPSAIESNKNGIKKYLSEIIEAYKLKIDKDKFSQNIEDIVESVKNLQREENFEKLKETENSATLNAYSENISKISQKSD